MNIFQEIKNFLQKSENPIIILLGPTASGKTALSLKIAQKFQGEIISTDSRQIYKEMEIGTDALLEKDQEGVLHYMIGIRKPDETLTLAEYKDEALKIIEEIYLKKKVPMLVGGTGLYIDAIIKNYNVPRVPPDKELRNELEELAKKGGKEAVYRKLEQVDPKAAKRIHPNNLRYVIRAIEVAESEIDNSMRERSESKFQTFKIGIKWPRPKLYERVNLRVDLQVERGLVDEVRQLLDKGYKENLASMSSLGVKEIIPYIKEQMELEECLEILKRNTRRYAKRQMTWFRRYDDVNWITPEELEKLTSENG